MEGQTNWLAIIILIVPYLLTAAGWIYIWGKHVATFAAHIEADKKEFETIGKTLERIESNTQVPKRRQPRR